MSKVLIEVEVAFPKKFYETLELQASVRQNMGEKKCLFHGVDDSAHNKVFIVFDWASATLANRFWQSDVAQSHMSDWNSIIPPRVTILRDSPSD